MAKPSDKGPEMDSFIDGLLSGMKGKRIRRRETIESDTCVICSGPATQFEDELSRREYSISGMCQKCQNEVFG